MKRIKRIILIITFAIMVVLLSTSPILAKDYTVQNGDSLFLIGQKFGISVAELKLKNNLDSNIIFPGQKFWIPSESYYKVKKGDTLFLIAQKYDMTYSELIRLNGLSSSLIYPGQKLYIQNKDDKVLPMDSRYILGFYVDEEYNYPGSYNQMVKNSSQISAIAPFWYRLSPTNGSQLQEHHSEAGFTSQKIKAIIKKAHLENIQVMMLVHNLLYEGQTNSKELAKEMLATVATRKKFIDQVEGLLKEYGYDGINMDVENIYLNDRDKFSLLIKEMYQRLAPQGYQVTVCIPAKTEENLFNTWSGPFDYKAIGRHSHFVTIMTYDEHGYSSGPGPIASEGWVKDVVEYTVKNIPVEKILLGIPGYGFDWKVGQKGPRYISYAQAMDIAAKQGVNILWDKEGKVPYFKYQDKNGQAHQVWFENVSSLTHKLDILDEYNLGGIALWRLGLEDPEMWKVLQSKVKAKK